MRARRIPTLRKHAEPKIEDVSSKTMGKTSHSFGTTTPTPPVMTSDAITLDLDVLGTPQIGVELVGTSLDNSSSPALQGLWVDQGGRVDFFARRGWTSDRALLVECRGDFAAPLALSYATLSSDELVTHERGGLTLDLEDGEALAFVVPATPTGDEFLRIRVTRVEGADERLQILACTFTRLA
ncbi:MAG TPA: hypothetical protein VG755_44130 [Nannocystaceae bacterium]|nr:hypothetical protein [Nannocystaceae bacterium]